jgi:hypothetical protein
VIRQSKLLQLNTTSIGVFIIILLIFVHRHDFLVNICGLDSESCQKLLAETRKVLQ